MVRYRQIFPKEVPMGNVTGRTAIELANAIHGVSPETGLVNAVFEIFDGNLIVETIDGDDSVDFTDHGRLRLVMACVVFGDKLAKISQKFHDLPDPEDADARFHALIEGLSGDELEEHLLAKAVNEHPELRTLVAFTMEEGEDGVRVHRLYRNPNVERDHAFTFLRKMREEFRARRERPAPPDMTKN